jgi:hypothetical protein
VSKPSSCILEVKPRDSGRWTRVSCGGPPSEIKKATPPHQLPKIALISRGNFGMPKSRCGIIFGTLDVRSIHHTLTAVKMQISPSRNSNLDASRRQVTTVILWIRSFLKKFVACRTLEIRYFVEGGLMLAQPRDDRSSSRLRARNNPSSHHILDYSSRYSAQDVWQTRFNGVHETSRFSHPNRTRGDHDAGMEVRHASLHSLHYDSSISYFSKRLKASRTAGQ